MRTLIVIVAVLFPGLSLRAELRTFRNTKGEEIKAEMLDATDSRAELKREDGKKFSVPLTSLSEADRKWIAEWRKTHKRFKVEMTAATRKGNSRTEKGAAFDGKDVRGNDCWYVLNFNNKTAEPLAGLRVEYIIFAPVGSPVPSLCGATDVAEIPAGKAGQAVTGKLFAEQAQIVHRAGNTSIVRLAENSLAGIHAELIVAGKPAGTFLSGTVPEDAGAQLQQWREKQQPAGEKGKEP
jgi:hypothetical protein